MIARPGADCSCNHVNVKEPLGSSSCRIRHDGRARRLPGRHGLTPIQRELPHPQKPACSIGHTTHDGNPDQPRKRYQRVRQEERIWRSWGSSTTNSRENASTKQISTCILLFGKLLFIHT